MVLLDNVIYYVVCAAVAQRGDKPFKIKRNKKRR